MKVKELIALIGNRAIINIHRKDGTNLYLSQCSEEYNQSKIEDYFDRDIAKIEIANSVDKYDGIIRIFVENEEEPIYMSSKEALKDVIPFNFNESSNIEVNMKEYENRKGSELEETWADRFKAEYNYVKNRYDNLHQMIIQYEAGTLDFTPNCSLELYKRQAKAMGEYLYILEIRAEIEGIELDRNE